MNEKIKQISDEVWAWSEQQTYNEPDEFSDIWETEFARRIIRECIKTMHRQELFSHPEYKWTDREIGYNQGINAAIVKIREHFGLDQ